MAFTTQTLNMDALLSTTMQAYRPKMEDNIFLANPLWYWLNRQGKKKMQNGGTSLLVPVMYGKNTTAKSYAGYDTLDTSSQDGMTVANYPWRQLSASISISRIEERKNSGESQVINLLESKIMQAEMSLIEEADRQSFGVAAGQDIFGLQLLVENATAGAWLSDVGGINRTTETWWRNQWAVGTAFLANGLDFMRTMYNSCSKGNIHPDLIVTYQTIFEYYEKILAANERFIDTTTGDAGFQNLLFKAAVMMYDAYCNSGSMYFLTSDYLWLYVDSQTDLYTTPFQRPVDQDAKVAQILWYGNLAASNCARHGVIDGITPT